MRKRLTAALLVLTVVMFGIDSRAELKVPKLTGRIVDNAHILSQSDIAKVNGALQQFEAATKGQMAVLIIPSLEGDALESFSMRVAEKWKIGYKGEDNGLLLLISMREHKIRLEVGYGFEGNINDARAGDIIRGMQPFFRSKRYADGIVYAVLRAQEMITGEKSSMPLPVRPAHKGSKGGDFPIFLIAFLIIFGLSFFGNRRGGGRRGGGWIITSGGFSSGGGFSGGFGGGGFSGGGGGFGGGGASGGW